jgi:glycosyltransferase involved in cell wall biosynthesis
MPVRNAERTIIRAIKSVLAQTYPHFELVIIDDGSTDTTATRIASVTDPRIKLIVDGGSLGLAARLNEIAAVARGSLIARMDGDDFSYPDRFERQVAFLNANPAIDLVGTSAIAFRPTGEPLGTFYLPITP